MSSMWMGALLLPAFAQQAPETILRQKDALGWSALGEGSHMEASGGGLIYTYDIAPKKLSGIVIGAPQDFERTGSIRFSMLADHDTAMGVLLSEKKPGGGNYVAWFWAPGGVRQDIVLTPADFSATDGAGDPVDTDGKLDLDQVQGIGILDLAQFFLGMPNTSNLPFAMTITGGRHSFTLNDFALLTGTGGALPVQGNSVALDTFDRKFLDWIALGGIKLQWSAGNNPLGMHAMQAAYHPREGQVSLLLRRVANPALSKAKRLSFDIASEHEVTLVVALEMKKPGGGGGEGPRFSLPIYPPGGKEVFHVDLDLADFKGPGGVFDPGQWRTIAILDASAAEGQAEADNTIWIGNMEVRN